MNHLPILIILLYLGSALLIPLLAGRFSSRWLAVAAAALALILSGLSAWHVAEGGTYSYFFGSHSAPFGVEFAVDWVTVLLHLTINFIGLAILVYCNKEIDFAIQSWFYTLFLLLMVALNGLVMAYDLFAIFLFTELGTLTACALVAVKPKALCVEAAFKYLILSTLGSGLILLGISLIYMATGNLNLGALGATLPSAYTIYPWNIRIALSLFIVGFGIKSALFPLHIWLPDAHSASLTPTSAIHSSLVVKIYIIAAARIIFQAFGDSLISVLPLPQVLLLLATFGIFAGSLLAMLQTDIKRMLAYSTVAQISYIFLGIGLMTKTGVMGGLLHVINHGIMKSLLFLAAGTIIAKTGSRKIEDLSGMGYRMPLTMTVFSIGALSMVGIPGFSGYVSKLYLAFGAMEAGKPLFVVIILLSSLLNAFYYLPIVVRAFFSPGRHNFTWDGLSWQEAVPMLALAAVTIYFGLLPGVLVNLAKMAAAGWLN